MSRNMKWLVLLLSIWDLPAFVHSALETYDDGLDSSVLAEGFSPDQTVDLDSSGLFADESQLDSSSLLANTDLFSSDTVAADDNTLCDSSNVDHLQPIGKIRRRGESCSSSPIVGGDSSQSDQEEPSDLGFYDFAREYQLQMSFPKNFETCPSDRFITSNIPVCKDYDITVDISWVIDAWANLRHVQPLFIDTPGNSRCLRPKLSMWCCHNLVASSLQVTNPLSGDVVDRQARMDATEFIKFMGIVGNQYDAEICAPANMPA